MPRKLSTRGPYVVLHDFKPLEGSYLFARTGDFLDYARIKLPGKYIPYEVITRCVYGQLGGQVWEETRKVKTALTRADTYLEKKTGHYIVRDPGIGARSTINELDKLRYNLIARSEDVGRRHKKLTKRVKNIDPKKLADDVRQLPPGMDRDIAEQQVAWFHADLKPAVKVFDGSRMVNALSGPAVEVEEEVEEEKKRAS